MKNYTFVHASVCILEICQMTKSGGEGKLYNPTYHQPKAKNRTSSFVMSPYPTHVCHDSSPLVSPPYRPLLSNLVNGGILNP